MIRKPKSVKDNEVPQETDNKEVNDCIIAAKIKRLKIEESLLLQTFIKNYPTIIHTSTSDGNISDNQISDYRQFALKLKEFYGNIYRLFEDIEGSVSSKEAIRSLDIAETEDNICELEQKIKYLKNDIELQLSSLKLDETELLEKLNNKSNDVWVKSGYITQGSKYKEISSSPVRVLISSSWRSPEVQEFQDFISKAQNRYGGWNEYHHNIFVSCWNKYFKIDCNTDFENFITNIEKSNVFQQFLHEILRKMKNFKTDEIVEHSKWYSKYVYLKERQQAAINKWKTNKILIKKSTSRVVKDVPQNAKQHHRYTMRNSNIALHLADEENKEERKINTNQNETMGCDNDKNVSRKKQLCAPFQYNKATKQWLSRCQANDNSMKIFSNSVEDIRKLRIPNWRIDLLNN